MRGLWLGPRGASVRDDLPEPSPGPGEALVEVLVAGVCATDLALARGYMGFEGIPGHEFVGRALEGPLAGRLVVGEINAACGACPACRAGLGRHCPRRTVLGILGRPGAFAERLALPEANLHPLPDGLTPDRAVFTEPLAAAFEVLEQVPLEAGTRALVVGDGRLGLLVARVLAGAGAAVDLLGRHPERAFEGATHRTALPAPGAEPAYDLAVEATGDPAALAGLFGRVRPRGTIVLKTTSERPAALDLAPLVVDEVTLLGSRCGPFEPALGALASGAVPVDSMVHGRFPLDEADRALQRAAAPGTLKILIDISPRTTS